MGFRLEGKKCEKQQTANKSVQYSWLGEEKQTKNIRVDINILVMGKQLGHYYRVEF